MKTIYLFMIIYLLVPFRTAAQIEVIEGLADAASAIGDVAFSGAGCDVISECCFDGGCFLMFEFFIDHQEEIMDMRDENPGLLSLELDASYAYSLHYANPEYFTHIDYLPRARLNLGVFSADFRYNILTEYKDDSTDFFGSWDLVGFFNLVPDPAFQVGFGGGIYYEMYTGNYYNEYYLGSKIGTFDNKDFINLDARWVVSYTNSVYPFSEFALSYNTKIVDTDHFYAYITLGGIYQNYYSAYDIWGAKGGLIFNIH